MAETIKIADAKTRFSELVAKVEAGAEIVISRGNEPVAKLVPLDDRARRKNLIAAMRAERDSGARARVTMDEILAWRHEDHRY